MRTNCEVIMAVNGRTHRVPERLQNFEKFMQAPG